MASFETFGQLFTSALILILEIEFWQITQRYFPRKNAQHSGQISNVLMLTQWLKYISMISSILMIFNGSEKNKKD